MKEGRRCRAASSRSARNADDDGPSQRATKPSVDRASVPSAKRNEAMTQPRSTRVEPAKRGLEPRRSTVEKPPVKPSPRPRLNPQSSPKPRIEPQRVEPSYRKQRPSSGLSSVRPRSLLRRHDCSSERSPRNLAHLRRFARNQRLALSDGTRAPRTEPKRVAPSVTDPRPPRATALRRPAPKPHG